MGQMLVLWAVTNRHGSHEASERSSLTPVLMHAAWNLFLVSRIYKHTHMTGPAYLPSGKYPRTHKHIHPSTHPSTYLRDDRLRPTDLQPCCNLLRREALSYRNGSASDEEDGQVGSESRGGQGQAHSNDVTLLVTTGEEGPGCVAGREEERMGERREGNSGMGRG